MSMEMYGSISENLRKIMVFDVYKAGKGWKSVSKESGLQSQTDLQLTGDKCHKN